MSQSKNVLFFMSVLFIFSTISISTVSGFLGSPSAQMTNGVLAVDVVCKNELQLMLRTNGDANCVKISSITKFVDLGIAEFIDTSGREPIIEEEIEEEVKETPVVGIDITPEKIFIKSEHLSYKSGSVLIFNGTAIPNEDLEVSLQDPNENEVYSDIIEVDDSGIVHFEVITDASFADGTYFLISSQLGDSEITPVVIGKRSGDIVGVIEKFNHESNSQTTLEIFGPSSSEISIVVYDSHKQKRFEDIVQLGENGYAEYLLDLSKYSVGVYSILLAQGTEEITEEFAIGLRYVYSPIQISLVKDSYHVGDTVRLFGKSSGSGLILIEIINPNGEIMNEIEYYTQRDGSFLYPFEIPLGTQFGTWTIRVSGAYNNISEINLDVIDHAAGFTIKLDKEGSYNQGDFVTISGYNMSEQSLVVVQIKSTTIIDELTISSTKDYTFNVIWEIPNELPDGTYIITANSGTSQATVDLIVG